MLTTPTCYNKTLTSADTEYSQALTHGVRAFSFHCRTAADVRFAFSDGEVATPTAPYMTLKAGQAYGVEGLCGKPGLEPTLYLASSTAGVIVEIMEWV